MSLPLVPMAAVTSRGPGERAQSKEQGNWKSFCPGTLERTADRAFHGVTWAHVYQALMGQTLSGAQGQPGGPELRAQELS